PGDVQRVAATITAYSPFTPDQFQDIEAQVATLKAQLEDRGDLEARIKGLPEYTALEDLKAKSKQEVTQLEKVYKDLATHQKQFDDLSLTGMGVTSLAKKIAALEAQRDLLVRRAPLWEKKIKEARESSENAQEEVTSQYWAEVKDKVMAPVV